MTRMEIWLLTEFTELTHRVCSACCSILESEQKENADTQSSFARLLPVHYTRNICNSMLKHEIQSCNVVGVVSSLHCIDPCQERKKTVYPAGSGKLKSSLNVRETN